MELPNFHLCFICAHFESTCLASVTITVYDDPIEFSRSPSLLFSPLSIMRMFSGSFSP